MKTKFLSLFLFLAIAFTGCEQEDVTPTTVDDATLAEFISLATSATSNAVNDSTSTTSNQCVGKRSGLTEVEVSALSTPITSYITTNYAGATIERAGRTSQGGFVVQIAQTNGTRLALLFDASGAFVSVDTHRGRGTEVEAANLPAAITTYITNTYSGSTIVKAIKDTTGAFVVVIKEADATITGLAFTAEGTFTSELSLQGEFGRGKGGRGGHKPGR